MNFENSSVNTKTPEQAANFEGNDTNLLLARLSNPKVLDKLVATLHAAHIERAQSGLPVLQAVFDDEDRAVLNQDGSQVFQEVPYEAPTEEEVRKEVLQNIEQAGLVTAVSLEEGMPTDYCIPLYWKLPDGITPTTKQKSIVEAHEKGHAVRSFPVSYEKLFGNAFDLSLMTYTEDDHERDKGWYSGDESFEDAKEGMLAYMSKPEELFERMSQLKNYFGFKGDEIFTREHLRYAREQYIADTGMDNYMRQFFEAIADEDEFVRKMNELGV